MTKISRKLEYLLILPLCAVFFFFGAGTVQATTYYVSTTGNDSNPGTAVDTPFRSIQKCTTVMVAGDTCTVADGDYFQSDGTVHATSGRVVNIATNSGTSVAPITLKSTNKWGAKLNLPNIVGTNEENIGFRIGRSWWTIDGFEIRQSGSISTTSNTVNHGFTTSFSAITGLVIKNNYIHNIGRGWCSPNGFGFTGIFVGLATQSNIIIDNNVIASVGRLRLNENGCNPSVSLDQNDHGMYIDGNGGGITGITISRNLCYDTNRGYCIQFFGASPAVVTNSKVWNNTFADGSPTGWPVGQIVLAGTMNTSDFKNNIFYNPLGAPIYVNAGLSCSAITMDYSLTNNTNTDLFYDNPGKPACVTSGTHNLINTSPGFTDASTRNYRLAPGSAAIDAGTNIGLPFTAAAPEIGAFEVGDSTAPTSPQNLTIK